MDTYRLSKSQWAQVVKGNSQSKVISNVKKSGGFKDTIYDEAMEWTDAFYCSGGELDIYTCTSFQPKYETGTGQGYPRFGIEESEAGDFTYVRLAKKNASIEVKDFIIQGATTIAAGIAVAAIFLAF